MTPEPGFDVIVVGSGAGGAAATYRLARAGLRVLLLEKGHALPGDGSTLDVDRVVRRGEFLSREPWRDAGGQALVPEEHFNLGGKTKWYGAALLRFSAAEFATDPGHDCSGWPITQQDLAPYYEEAESLLAVRSFPCEPTLAHILDRLTRGERSWRATPLPMALAPGILENYREAAHFDGFATVAGLKADAENALLARVVAWPHVRIVTGAEVVALLPHADDTRRIAGVRLADGRVYRGSAVLLAAGALHSPRLLERYVAQHGLAATLPAAQAIGRHLKLHLLTALVAVSLTRNTDLLRKTMLVTHAGHPHSSVQPLGFDAELIATLVPRAVPRLLAAAVGSRAYGFFLQTEDGSHPDNRITHSHGDGSPPVIDYDARRTPAAAVEHRRFVAAFRRSLLRAGRVSFAQRIGATGTAHACGTLAAGTDAASSVVDALGRVHGLQSLYVVDGSVLPRSSRVNPSLTIYAWSLRVADLLVRRLWAEVGTNSSARADG
jgi:choline dehydrogenase-like flavoprotein